jgi:hypothetical protein
VSKQVEEHPVSPELGLAAQLAARFKARASYERVLDKRGNEMMTLEETFGVHSQEYGVASEKLSKDKEEVERIKEAIGRPIARWHVSLPYVLTFGVGLALMEAFANQFLFEVALQARGYVAYLVSVVITGFLLLLSHIAGSSIRQVWSEFRRKFYWGALVVCFGALAISLIIVGILTIARAQFATDTGTIDDLLNRVQTDVVSVGLLGMLSAALAEMHALVLACINIGGIGVTFLIAYFSHDPDRSFDHAQSSMERNEAKLAKLYRRYVKARAAVVERYSTDLVGFAANYNTANAQVIKLKSLLSQPLEDEDRLVVTSLDQMAEDAERQRQLPENKPVPRPHATDIASEPTIATMSDYRR